MICAESLCFKKSKWENHEYSECDYFLNYFEFYQWKRASIFTVSQFIGRYLKDILKKGNTPANENNVEKSEMLKPFQFFELQMSIPGNSHEGIREYQQDNSIEWFHLKFVEYLASNNVFSSDFVTLFVCNFFETIKYPLLGIDNVWGTQEICQSFITLFL